MTVKGGTSQACAACKYQRRKCSETCELKPYFPADQPKKFQNAHRLYGVSNILKILKNLNPNQKFEAMRSITFESDMREKFPVYGCYGAILQLQYVIHQNKMELDSVLSQLNICKSSHLQLGNCGDSASNALQLFQPHQSQYIAPQHPHQRSYLNGNDQADSKESLMNPLWPQHVYSSNNLVAVQPQFIAAQGTLIQQQFAEAPGQDYDEIPSFFDTIDDRQSYIDSKEACDSSSDSSVKDTKQSNEQVAENELKSAAACFSLTSAN
ncbi:hypothetical protein GIB67_032980 [Kingdonia uniflora]|uniref:LOB domain-containing protein n=1 Tax=Kingdonia uniflora TaxID=39325 RepID=A0A7J7MYF1_9MAGN|nr:hypothetical protein GIB67_032980 [Kingdonia uniflora]